MPQAAVTESVRLRACLVPPAFPISVKVITCPDRVRALIAAPFVIRNLALTSVEVGYVSSPGISPTFGGSRDRGRQPGYWLSESGAAGQPDRLR